MRDSKAKAYVDLPGSMRQPVVGARKLGTVDPNDRIEISVYLKARAQLPNSDEYGAGGKQKLLTREKLGTQYGADPGAIDLIEQFARDHHLAIVEADAARRVVRLAGSAEAMQAAFNVQLGLYERKGHAFRQRTGSIQVPANLLDVIDGIFGLDDRVQAHAHFRARMPGMRGAAPHNGTQTYTPVEIAKLYRFPALGTGSGQTIGIIELRARHGGGYRPVDLKAYFKSLGTPLPIVTSISVDGGHNAPTGDPSDPESADVEVALDIEVAGAVAPGAHLVVYFAPNTDQGFIDAIRRAVHDTQHQPSVLSISWGAPESSWTAQAMTQMDQAFSEAAAVGVTVCCAAGDSGAQDSVTDGEAHADFPASSPHVLACGGTHLESSKQQITQETVWNGHDGGATGGGISDVFARPAWQTNVPPSMNPGGHVGRGLPDVSGNADPATGYQVLVDGQSAPVGGTSAVAPLWAGLIALLNERLSRPVGYLNPLLYQTAAPPAASIASALRDITAGDNGTQGLPGYIAGPGWDACTGFGTPDGTKLLDALTTAVGARP